MWSIQAINVLTWPTPAEGRSKRIDYNRLNHPWLTNTWCAGSQDFETCCAVKCKLRISMLRGGEGGGGDIHQNAIREPHPSNTDQFWKVSRVGSSCRHLFTCWQKTNGREREINIIQGTHKITNSFDVWRRFELGRNECQAVLLNFKSHWHLLVTSWIINEKRHIGIQILGR